jgi:septal ring factor EnvC (AmiA/AmiB activator)
MSENQTNGQNSAADEGVAETAAEKATRLAAAKQEANAEARAAAEEQAKKEAAAAAKLAKEGKKPKHTGKQIRVMPANPFKLFCPTQDTTIYPETITEVKDDEWIRGQLNEGVLLKK